MWKTFYILSMFLTLERAESLWLLDRCQSFLDITYESCLEYRLQKDCRIFGSAYWKCSADVATQCKEDMREDMSIEMNYTWCVLAEPPVKPHF